MRITILQGAFLPVPALRGGAVEKVWLALGREFARLGHEVCHVSRLCDDLPADEIVDGVYHRRVPGFDAPESLARLKWYDLLFTRRAVAVLPDADLIVTNTFWAPVLVKPRHGRIWVHVQRYPRHQMNLYFRATQLQAVSTVIAQAIIKQAPRLASRVSVIPNPLPPVAPTPMAAQKDPNLILFVGRVHPEKGLDLLIRAMTTLRTRRPAARLRVVGPWERQFGGGGLEYFLKLHALAEPLGKNVEFVGPVFDETVLSIHYDEATAFVYPTLAAQGEASPVAPLEALAHGLPVVVSDLACFDDYLRPGDSFAHRFDEKPENAPEKLAEILEGILNSSATREEVARAAQARAAEFSVRDVARRYLEAFASVVPDHNDRSHRASS